MALDGQSALDWLERIGNSNAQKEYYLPDAVAVARADGAACALGHGAGRRKCWASTTAPSSRSRKREIQRRLRLAAMLGGATLVAPETRVLQLRHGSGRRCAGRAACGVRPRRDASAMAASFTPSRISKARRSAKNVSIGPYARLRPGAKLAERARVGNFVEIKQADIGEGAKVNHLTYIGDASIGARANIGAGVITCNYDGFLKYRTTIGADAFIGSNSALVAPVEIGDGAFVGSGSVVTDNVAPTRSPSRAAGRSGLPGWAEAFRKRMAALKAEEISEFPAIGLTAASSGGLSLTIFQLQCDLRGSAGPARASCAVADCVEADGDFAVMCGIVGILGQGPVAGQLIDALKRLEYRGYDSAGIATLEDGKLQRRRAEGKLRNLEAMLHDKPLHGSVGIGHTRWATHGRPTENNAHPHATDKLAVVHNGIIENFRELRDELAAQGHVFVTQTDTEAVAHLVTEQISRGLSPERGGRRQPAAAEGRLRAGLPVRGRRQPADRRAARRAAGGRLWRGRRDVSRLRRAGAGRLHRHHHLSRRRRLGDPASRLGGIPQRGQRAGVAAEAEDAGLRLPGRQGQLPAFHGQGNP